MRVPNLGANTCSIQGTTLHKKAELNADNNDKGQFGLRQSVKHCATDTSTHFTMISDPFVIALALSLLLVVSGLRQNLQQPNS